MAKRKVKTLNKTGRISRDRAEATAMALRDSGMKSGKFIIKKHIDAKSTASGSAKISFHVKGKLTGATKAQKKVAARKTA